MADFIVISIRLMAHNCNNVKPGYHFTTFNNQYKIFTGLLSIEAKQAKACYPGF